MSAATAKSNTPALATLTVRDLPADVDAAITAQAKAAGKSKSDFIQAYLSVSFGDLIGNFSRCSGLVAQMDRELASATGLPLTYNWYDAGHTLMENREYCHLLHIQSEGDLQRILMAATPLLTMRVQQLDTDIPLLPRGISLTCALFIEAAGRELADLLVFRRRLFWFMNEEQFRADVDAIRQARLLPPLLWPEY